MKRNVLLAALFLASSLPVSAQTPENAVVVIIDGMRDDEGFGAESLYLRHIWNDLRPLGTVHKRFWDRGWTATTGGHTTILSGVRQILRNNGSNEQEIRSFDPLVFEYYRQYFGITETTACGVVIGKTGNVGDIADFGIEPAYGAPWQGFVRGDATTHDDTISMRLLFQAMDSTRPRLVLLNMADVDTKGHAAVYADYLQSIRTADSLIYQLWQRIQAVPPYTDTFYRNKTVLIVTSDHGRNDDAHGSFIGHGEWDHGSRQIGFLALGPRIAANRIVTSTTGDQIDIVPTVGAMLGFPVPFAEGRVMTELFTAGYAPRPVSPKPVPMTDAVNLSNTADFSRDPDVCRDRAGNLYLVWSERLAGNWGVRFRKSTDNGASWSTAQAMFNFPASESVMWYARVAADDSVAVSAIGFGKHLNPIDSSAPSRADTTFIWYPWLATSANAGATWGYRSLLDSGMGSYYAPATVKNGRYGVAWWAVGQFAWQSPRNGILFNNRSAAGAWRTLPVRPIGAQSIHLTMADDGVNYHIASSAWQGSDFDLGYHRSTDGGTTWATTWVARDTTANPNYDYDPELVVDGTGMVHVFWARKANVGGTWRITYGRRNVSTGVFDTTAFVTSPAGAWQPHAAIKGDTICLVWIDYRDGNPELYCRYSLDRGANWSAPERVTYSDALTHHPRVTATSAGFYVVWQDISAGNWEIYGRDLDLGQGRDVGVVAIAAPAGTVESLAAVVPRAGFHNYGPATASFPAFFSVFDGVGTRVYHDSVTVVDLGPGATGYGSFPVWPKPHALGNYTTRCSTGFRGDYNSSNDLMTSSFTVIAAPAGWHEKQSMPNVPSGKQLKDGAWLAPDPGTSTIFAAKGYKTADFYAYSPDLDSWQELAVVPRGFEDRPVGKGSVGCSDGYGGLYAVKGNNTQGFYRYDIGAGTWTAAADVPLGTTRKKVKGGGDMVYVEKSPTRRYMYLLKGYKNEFWRYDILVDSWTAMPDAPTGTNLKYNNGSFLVYDGANTIYCHKSKFHELWAYRTDLDSWSSTVLKPMPFVGRSGRARKAKDGSSGAWAGDGFYAFKGANTQELWRYFVAGDSWFESDTIPAVGSSLKKKRVKAGGDLAPFGPAVYFAFKGNRCNELWRYVVAMPYAQRRTPDARQSVQSGATREASGVMRVHSPLPPGVITVQLSSSILSPRSLSLSVYDALGRAIHRQAVPRGASSVQLDLSRLGAGIYLVRSENGVSSETRKLVIR